MIPMALRGLWGSFFSHKGGPALKRRPRRFWSRLELVVGEPMAPETVTAERAGDKLAVTADPADARSGSGGFVGKVPPDGLRVGPFGCGQRPGGVPVALDFLSQSDGKIVDPLVEPLVLSGVGRGWAGCKLRHDLGRHRKREGDGTGKRSAGWSQGRDKRGEVGGAEKRNVPGSQPIFCPAFILIPKSKGGFRRPW